MPYIKPFDRSQVDSEIDHLIVELLEFQQQSRSGACNYTFTRILHSVFGLDNPTYEKINTCIGILGCVQQELYRRKAVPYEEKKIIENGDI